MTDTLSLHDALPISHVHDAANTLDHRKRQVEQAEERLARAEATLADVQAALERLHGQKAIVDQAVTQASTLEFHTKQAETMITALRQEREISEHGASHLREERRSTERPSKKTA